MNADTKKKIDDFVITINELEHETPYTDCAEFGYNLALKDAEVLVKALEEVIEFKPDTLSMSRTARQALVQWEKVTE